MDRSELEALVSEALVDAYGPDGELTAWSAVLEDALAVPSTTTVLGREVTVTKLEIPENGGIRAVCVAEGHRQRIAPTDLPLPEPPPVGAEWVAAYRWWSERA
jgi:hypothetical protein